MIEMNVIQNYLNDDSVSSTTASNSDFEGEKEEVFRNENYNGNKSFEQEGRTQISSNINSIDVQSSSEMHFGNKIICNGPVTINHTIDDKSKSLADESAKIKEEHTEVLEISSTRRKMLIILSLIISIVLMVLFTLVYKLIFVSNSADNEKVDEKNQNDSLKIISRNEWNAKPSSEDHKELSAPVSVILTDYINKHGCRNRVRKLFINQNAQKNCEKWEHFMTSVLMCLKFLLKIRTPVLNISYKKSFYSYITVLFNI